jgi:hypothetical protein
MVPGNYNTTLEFGKRNQPAAVQASQPVEESKTSAQAQPVAQPIATP